MAYDATEIIIQGLEQISKPKQQSEREQLNNVIQKNPHYGANGKSSFDDQGLNVNESADYVIQIKNGQFTPLRF
jgi:ABC-type branched-subunit amino acid transport system substrate-binding protein